MADETPSPEHLAAANLLSFAKAAANEQLIRALNGMTTNGLTRYPQAEVQTWPYQKAEAAAVIAAGAGATLAMAPLLTKVCQFEFGAATNAIRLGQVKTKAAQVQANDEAWLTVAAFVNGLRARAENAISAATTAVEVSDTLNAALAEAETFRNDAGL